VLSIVVVTALASCAPGKTPAARCDVVPTGIARTVTRLPFTVPAGLLPDPQFDGLPAELSVNVVKPVYAAGRCAGVEAHAVVLVHGRSVPAVPTFDLRAPDPQGPPGRTLSVQEALAWSGIDTYAPDLLGYGGSTRFEHGLDDPCNASLRSCADASGPFPEGCDTSANPIFPLDQQGTVLGRRCPHSSRTRFGRTDVWVRDLRQVVDFALDDARPDGGKLVLLGLSAGGLRVGRALDARVPGSAGLAGKVSRVIFVSSIFGGPTDEPDPAPAITFPMTLARFAPPPPDPVACQGRTIPGTYETLWQQSLETDPVGRTWATGVVRSPTFSTYGWNPDVAGQVTTPTLIVQGLDDTTLGQPPLFGSKSACAIYAALPPRLTSKVVVRVGCATHSILFQGCSGDRCTAPHATVKAAVIEWVKHGTFDGHPTGSFVVDRSGVTTDAPCPN
jgi:pimeloyl-ACP methyl ester carboxylesterase